MAKIPKKFRGVAEKASLPRFYIISSVTQGYTVRDRNEERGDTICENMWDAIELKKSLSEKT